MFIPKTAQDYIDRATACEALADAATSPETRETMLYLAGGWRALADEAEAQQRRRGCRATIKVRKPDNQDEKVVALLVS